MLNTNNTALSKALKLMKSADRFESELRLLLSEFEPSDVEEAISWLHKHGLLSDIRTLESTLNRKSGKRAIGIELLRQELLSKGVSPDLLDETLSVVDEKERALESLTKKYPPDPKNRAKAGRFLFSRGFSEDSIEAALEAYFSLQND